ncbi:MAG: polyphosphate kinase 2 family protein [Christensenellales bacterium]
MDTKQYLVKPGEKVDLSQRPTGRDKAVDKSEAVTKLMPRNLGEMAALQEKLYANNRYALLIVLQAMDAAGKDGVIKHVMSGLNPQGVQVVSFKQPSSEELDHDYLWRISKALPRRGEIGIFNRSHYEEVIVTKIHNLVAGQQIPKELLDKDIWKQRYRHINDFEDYLESNGIAVVKFYLHLSKDEQRDRLLARIQEPDKNWKFSSADITERQYWDDYMAAYEEMLTHTSTAKAPWYCVPADQKWFARYVISEVVKEQLEELKPEYPVLPEAELAKLEECRQLLTSQ